jgi:hypothetical protein
MGDSMWRRRTKQQRDAELVTATEIACWVYCPEQWRLQYGLGLKPGNKASLDAGKRHHWLKAIAERFAATFIGIGSVLVVIALVALMLLWLVWR